MVPSFRSCIFGRLCDRDARITIRIFLGGFNGGAPPSRSLLFALSDLHLCIPRHKCKEIANPITQSCYAHDTTDPLFSALPDLPYTNQNP